MIKKILKKQIEDILRMYPKSRDSDIYLNQLIWYNFYKNKLENINGVWYIKLRSLEEVPTESDIGRVRRKIQNPKGEYLGKYLPTTIEIAKRRGIAEEKYRSYLGYNPELRTLTPEEIAKQIGGNLTQDTINI